jgi:hypothetical protein
MNSVRIGTGGVPPAVARAPHWAIFPYHRCTTGQDRDMSKFSNSGKAPTMWVWVISLVLYVVALASYFGVVKIDPNVTAGCWIVGLGLLLLACRVRGL